MQGDPLVTGNLSREADPGKEVLLYKWKDVEMDEQRQQYEEYITKLSPMAAVIGRRPPYHLTFIRKYGSRIPKPEGQPEKEKREKEAG